MVRKLVIGLTAMIAVGAGLVSGQERGDSAAPARAPGTAGCRPLPVFARGEAPGLATGRGVWAVAGGTLVSATAGRSLPARVAEGETIRHVATARGLGTAYVVDRPGTDEVVVVTRFGTRRIPVHAEATHPAWSPDGDLAWATGGGVAILPHDGGRIVRVDGPVSGGTVFSPVFLSPTRLAVAVAARPSRNAPEGGRYDDLWVTGLDGGGWRRVTSFRASGDRWVTIRTPIVADGTLSFVRVSARGSATGEPRFELWRSEPGIVHRARRLPGERYLAGVRRGDLVWNVPDPEHNRLLLTVAGRTIGCGAVMADPPDAVDPDRRSGHGVHVPPRGDWPELDTPTLDHTEEVAVIVGDFMTTGEAEAVAASIMAVYPDSRVDVVDSSVAPLAIRPGVYGALLHLPVDADPTAALAAFRERLPGYAANSWIVTP
ncbi:MAG TPA: hypothetical protein VFI59_02655 [Actinomycetota bacterium]|nr:hypothetical protein [Actinomycetota bacterium]